MPLPQSCMPTVTIITPFRNALHFIDEFVSMLLAQTYPYWSCILVDDCSTDDGPLILQHLISNDSRFRLLTLCARSVPTKSPAHARNIALSHVTSQLVAFCDIDDIWHPSKLSLQVSHHLATHSDISVTGYHRFSSDLDGPIVCSVCPPRELDLNKLLRSNPIPLSTVLLNSSYIQSFKDVHHEDYLYWLNLFNSHRNLRYSCLSYALTFYRVHSGNLTSNRLLMPFWAYSVYRNFGLDIATSVLRLLIWSSTHLLDRLKRSITKSFPCLCPAELVAMPPLRVRQA